MKLVYAALYLAALGILAHPVGLILPRSIFHPDSFPFAAYKWENGGKIYEKLGVKSWKDRVPDMSRLMGDMVKKKMSSAKDAAGIDTLIVETCIAEAIHLALTVLSFGILIFWQSVWAWVLILAYNILGNLPFIIIQRYNRPRLLALSARRAGRRQQKQ